MSFKITHEAWKEEAVRRYGSNVDEWRFRCPCCGYVASVYDWRSRGIADMVAFSCIGRAEGMPRRDAFGKGEGPCNYAGGGLFLLNPIHVQMPDGVIRQTFDFADRPLVELRGV